MTNAGVRADLLQRPMLRDRTIDRTTMAVRAAGVASVLLSVVLYQVLSRRIGGGVAVQETAFTVAMCTVLVASLVAVARARRYAEALINVSRTSPVLTAVLVANVIATSFITMTVFTEWGVILLLMIGGVGVLALGFARGTSIGGVGAMLAVAQNSPLTFGALYVALLVGEGFLRLNPTLVGGGGGGNPALASIYDGLYSINSLGLRDTELGGHPAPGVCRLMALGDSFTFGQGVLADSTYPELLERRLNSGSPTARFEVVNAGKPGWSTADELEFLRTQGLQMHPDVLILQFYANDIEIEERKLAETPAQRVRRLVTRPFRRSYVIFSLRYRFDGMLAQAKGEVSDENESATLVAARRRIADASPEWTHFQEALGELARVAKEAELPVVALLFPRPGVASEANRGIHAAVGAEARGLGMHVVDLMDDLQAVPRSAQYVSPMDNHPSAAAHAVAAERLERELVRERLIPCRS
jgi:lysophospholipase L1-like esterase